MIERELLSWEVLTCRTEERPDAIILIPSGEIDLETTSTLAFSLRAILDDGQNAVLFLGKVTYIDSTGIRVLLEMHRSFLSRGQRLILADPATVVRKIIDLVALGETIPVYESLESALMSLRTPADVGGEEVQRGAVR